MDAWVHGVQHTRLACDACMVYICFSVSMCAMRGVVRQLVFCSP
jgi:hypothetical protein